MEAARGAIQSLWDAEERQDTSSMVASLHSLSGHLGVHHRNDATTVRNILGISSNDINRLSDFLTSSLGDRVTTQELLPCTYDDAANEQAMQTTSSAMTLTETSLAAATVFAQLLSIPGALGAGLVEMEAVSALAALLQRWKVECCGREDAIQQVQNGKRSRGKNVSTGAGGSPNTRPNKSSRRSSGDLVTPVDDNVDDDESDSDESMLVVEEGPSSSLEPYQLITMGFLVTREISRVPRSKEFMSWSSEAREVIVNTVASSLATTAALVSGKNNSPDAKQLADQVVSTATQALASCLVKRGSGGADDSEQMVKQHETAVSILRGLYPTITMKDILPKGEAGKLAAASVASETLQAFIQNTVKELSTGQKRLSFSAAASRRSSIGSSRRMSDAALTPKSGRKLRRSSIGGKSTGKVAGVLTPPKLKGGLMTKTPSMVGMTSPNEKPRPVLTAILGVLQKLATDKALDKSSFRAVIVNTLHRCLEHLPIFERAHFLTFLIQLCHSKVSVHRLVGAEVVGHIISEDWLWKYHADTSPPPSTEIFSSDRRKSLSPLLIRSSENMPAALFAALQGRLQDRMPTIRTTSTTVLSNVFRKLMEQVDNDSSKEKASWINGLIDSLTEEGDTLLDALRKRSVDEKASVRRGAVDALSELIVLQNEPITLSDVNLFRELCQDPSIMVRRSAAEALTLLLEQDDTSKDLKQAWSSAVLTMVLDNETSCASKGVDLVESVIITPVLDDSTAVSTQKCAWSILAGLSDGSGNQSGGSSRSQTEALRSTIRQMATSGNVTSDFIKNILKRIVSVCVYSTDEVSNEEIQDDHDARRTGAWTLFEALVGYSKNTSEIARIIERSKIDINFVGTGWRVMLDQSQNSSGKSKEHLQRSVTKSLQVLTKLAPCMDVSLVTKTCSSLQQLLKDFSFPSEMIAEAIPAVVTTTCAAIEDIQDGPSVCKEWIRELYQACEDQISKCVGDQNLEDELPGLHRAIFTVGELSLVGFSASEDDASSKGATSSKSETHLDPLRGFLERPSQKLIDFVQAFASHLLPGSGHIQTPESVRAHSFVTIGKLCLRDQNLAKKSLNILARELHENMNQGGSWKVQSNALLVMGDLCVKYTNMVDKFLPVMAACMQTGVSDLSSNLINSSPCQGAALVRKHAILLLSNLILQDYVKWRGLLFHRFLVCSADEDEEVGHLAEMLLCGPLITKHPRLFSNQFVESIFVLNRCTAHPIYIAAASMGDGGSGISVEFEGINLTGEVGRARRMQMYQLMLTRMTDEEKIGVTARIAKEILGGALESGSDLNRVCTRPRDMSPTGRSDPSYESAANVLSDALAILSDPNMKVNKSGKGQNDDDIEDPNVSTNSTKKKMLVAKGRLLSNISRKHLIEIILPILCRLKVILQKSCSSLLKDLMYFLVGVFRQYKNEVKEFLANDPTLLQEIEYDARQFQKTQRKSISTPGTINKTLALTPAAVDIQA